VICAGADVTSMPRHIAGAMTMEVTIRIFFDAG
jgi:hypothetical protein